MLHGQKGKNMTKGICRRCGSALNDGARFCVKCGEVAIVVRSGVLYTPETIPLAKEETEQTVAPHAAPTEKMPAILMPRMESSDSLSTTEG
jgi:hypothetical protein